MRRVVCAVGHSLRPETLTLLALLMWLSDAGGADGAASRWAQTMRPTPASATLMAGTASRQVRLPDADAKALNPDEQLRGGTRHRAAAFSVAGREIVVTGSSPGIGAPIPPRSPGDYRARGKDPRRLADDEARTFPVRGGVPQRHSREPARREDPRSLRLPSRPRQQRQAHWARVSATGIVGRIQAMLEINIKAPFALQLSGFVSPWNQADLHVVDEDPDLRGDL